MHRFIYIFLDFLGFSGRCNFRGVNATFLERKKAALGVVPGPLCIPRAGGIGAGSKGGRVRSGKMARSRAVVVGGCVVLGSVVSLIDSISRAGPLWPRGFLRSINYTRGPVSSLYGATTASQWVNL